MASWTEVRDQPQIADAHLGPADAHREPGDRRGTRAGAADIERELTFLLAALIPAYLAIRGGAYDLVVRQEAGIVLWWGLALCLAFGVLPRARPGRVGRVPALALAGLAGWTALSLIWTESDERTFAELARVLDYGGIVAVALLGVHRGTWRIAAAGLLTSALAISTIAVASRIAPAAFPVDDVALTFDGERLSYPLDYWNAVGYWSAMAIAGAVAWSAHWRRPIGRALALGAAPIAGFAVFLTYSRGAVLATVFALVIVVALSRNRVTAGAHAATAAAGTGAVIAIAHGSPDIVNGTGGDGGPIVALALAVAGAGCAGVARLTLGRRIDRVRLSIRQRIVVAGAIAIAIAACVVAAVRIGSEGELLTRAPYEPGSKAPATRLLSVNDRRGELWDSALDAFATDPLKGIGAGSFELWHARTEPASSEKVADAHSAYIETLGELGLPGLALLVVALGGTLVGVLRARAAATRPSEQAAVGASVAFLGVWLLSLALDWTWEVPAVACLGLAAGGVGMAALSAPRRSRAARYAVPTRTGWGRWRFAAVAAAVLAGAAQVPGVVSEDRVRAAEFQLALGNLGLAEEHADGAVAAQPWAATPYAARATVRLRAGDLAGARADARAAARREPTNGRLEQLLDRIQGSEP